MSKTAVQMPKAVGERQPMIGPKGRHSAETLLDEGNLQLAGNNFPAAVANYRRALDLNPRLVEAAYNCGVALHKQGRLENAIGFYKQAIRLRPDLAEAYFNLAHALSDLNHTAEAEAAYRAVLRLQPLNAAANYNLGLLYKYQGQYSEAVKAFTAALDIRPDYAEAHNNIGVICRDQNYLEQARACFEKALAAKPEMVEALFNLGVVRYKQGDYAKAQDHFKRALMCNPQYAPARWFFHLALPMYYEREADIRLYRDRFSRHLRQLANEIRLDTPQAKLHALEGIATFTNFYLQYQGLDDRDLQREYGALATQVMAANFPQWSVPRPMPAAKAGERIRLGYLSSCMHGHTIGVFLLGWLEKLDHKRFEIFCYHVGDRTDALTESIRAASEHFFHFPGQVLPAAGQIDADRLHILVHTDIGMNPVTLQLAALRLAPVQCKGWGHPVTTGLPTIDYYLSSELMEPAQAERHYSEKLIRLPNLALNYTPPALPSDPKTRRQLGIPERAVVYLSTQSLFKYLPQHDDIYPRIASQVPDALFVFLAHGEKQVTDLFAKRLAGAFASHNLTARCIFLPRLNHADFLSLNMAADVLLDTLEWSGGKTSLEAIACDLPVVTLPGSFMRGRHTYAFLTRMGLRQTIAGDKDDYIRIAARLGADPEWRAQVKNLIKSRKHLLFNDTRVNEALEAFYADVCRPALPATPPPIGKGVLAT
jgi:predicted O-linked N-acetylglucosamine transferase (SPINDLY family)